MFSIGWDIPMSWGRRLKATSAAEFFSLAVLHALKVGGTPGDRLRSLLMKSAMTDADVAETAKIVASHGVAEARRRANAAADDAIAALATLRAGPVRRSLGALARWAVTREV